MIALFMGATILVMSMFMRGTLPLIRGTFTEPTHGLSDTLLEWLLAASAVAAIVYAHRRTVTLPARLPARHLLRIGVAIYLFAVVPLLLLASSSVSGSILVIFLVVFLRLSYVALVADPIAITFLLVGVVITLLGATPQHVDACSPARIRGLDKTLLLLGGTVLLAACLFARSWVLWMDVLPSRYDGWMSRFLLAFLLSAVVALVFRRRVRIPDPMPGRLLILGGLVVYLLCFAQGVWFLDLTRSFDGATGLGVTWARFLVWKASLGAILLGMVLALLGLVPRGATPRGAAGVDG